MKKILFAASIAAIILVFGGCSKKPAQGEAAASASSAVAPAASSKTSIDAIKARGKVRIGFFPDMPPWCSQGQDGKYTGYDVYFGHQIAKDLLGDENAIDYVPVDAASRVEFLKSDKVDIILANFTKTPERAEMVDFALPYMKTSIGVASPKSAPITSIDQ
jgi:polar amino acid transport system substrate-binding protein